MNEDQLADILAEQLDALLAGQPLPAELPSEISELWPISQDLVGATPQPRPEFGPALKQRLLESNLGPNGGGGSTGPGAGGYLPFIGLAGLLVFIVSLAILGALWAGLFPLNLFQQNSPPLPAPSTQTIQTEATDLPAPPSPTLHPPTATGTAADSLPTIAPTPTAVLDILPPITGTVESTEEIILPPDLVPGQSSSSDSDHGDKGGSGSSGDHNHGHGNDADHHDEDNPGHH